eukprot:gnl/MRDRNA2_/MRDRNA2_87989_c0_seq1.p1 gnl/MRDRNA2_/MRDRNA2_87989_c0~~gnl/MRDRNA2_/MRDRNA2_87989_c0_seq1.p1  ORF type:complete len:554 (+),score=138.72 gnl/MRDRNA2_/MRDRNA2_87989_c0_seq1:116-1777(+)
MSRICVAISVLAFAARAYTDEDQLADKLVSSLVSKLLDRALDEVPLDHADGTVLDGTTLGKPGALTLSNNARVATPRIGSALPTRSVTRPMVQAFHNPHFTGQVVPKAFASNKAVLAQAQARNFIRSPLKCMAASSLNKLKIEDVDVEGKRVFMRVDFNVPQDKVDPNIITNTQRIDAALPTIRAVLMKKPKSLVLASHLGRPDGKVNQKFSMEPVAKAVSEKLGFPVKFIKGWGPDMEAKVGDPLPGTIFVLDNLRFNLEEEGKGKDKEGNKITADKEDITKFRARIKSIADIYVNDAFGTAHRAHSSMVGEGFDVKATGQLMAAELSAFAKVLDEPAKPVLAILGGAKVTDKIQLIFNMLDKVDKLIIGGGMAFTFLKVIDGMTIGDSLYDEDGAKTVPDIMAKAKEKGVEIILPVDFTISSKFGEDGDVKEGVTKKEGIPDGFLGLDCGPESNKLNKAAVMASKTIIWNGPMGVFEMKKFEGGTKTLMNAVVEATEKGAISVIGGGDTATACKKYDTVDKVTHCSTGGGASMELLEGKVLPGVAALSDAC